MEEYGNKIKKRIRILAAGLAFCTIAIVAGGIIGRSLDGNMSDFMQGFQAGLIGGLGGIFVFLIILYVLALNNKTRLKKMYINETDERNLLIYNKSGSVGMNVVMVGLAAASAVAGYFDTAVFTALLCATFFTALVRAALKIYYSFKY